MQSFNPDAAIASAGNLGGRPRPGACRRGRPCASEVTSTDLKNLENLARLAKETSSEGRQHLAETMSGVGAAPYEQIKKFASDEIEVTRPVLMKSGVLQDADLFEIVKQYSQEHLMAVSTRDRVSEQVADALVEKGNDQILGSLAGNVGAELSRNAMETMVARSEGGEEALNEALVMRNGMPADLMRKMYSHVSSATNRTRRCWSGSKGALPTNRRSGRCGFCGPGKRSRKRNRRRK